MKTPFTAKETKELVNGIIWEGILREETVRGIPMPARIIQLIDGEPEQ